MGCKVEKIREMELKLIKSTNEVSFLPQLFEPFYFSEKSYGTVNPLMPAVTPV